MTFTFLVLLAVSATVLFLRRDYSLLNKGELQPRGSSTIEKGVALSTLFVAQLVNPRASWRAAVEKTATHFNTQASWGTVVARGVSFFSRALETHKGLVTSLFSLSLIGPIEAWRCCGSGKKCYGCGGPGCGLCAHDIDRSSSRCNYRGDAHRNQYYHDTCGGCSGNPGPWYCECFPGYTGSQCESLISQYPTLAPTSMPTSLPSTWPTSGPSSQPSRVPTVAPTNQRAELLLTCSDHGFFQIRTQPFNYRQRFLIGYGLGDVCDAILELDPESINEPIPRSEMVYVPVIGNGSHGTVYRYNVTSRQHCFTNNVFVLFGFHSNDFQQSINCCYDSLVGLGEKLPDVPEPVWKPPIRKEGDWELQYSVCGKTSNPGAAVASGDQERCGLNESSTVPHGTLLAFSVQTAALSDEAIELHLLSVVGEGTKGVRDTLFYDASAPSNPLDFTLKTNNGRTISWTLPALTFVSKLLVTLEVRVFDSGVVNGIQTNESLSRLSLSLAEQKLREIGIPVSSSRSLRVLEVIGNQMIIELAVPTAEDTTGGHYPDPDPQDPPDLYFILMLVLIAVVITIVGVAYFRYFGKKRIHNTDPRVELDQIYLERTERILNI